MADDHRGQSVARLGGAAGRSREVIVVDDVARSAAGTPIATSECLLDPHVLLVAVRDADDVIVDFEFVEANERACTANGIPRAELIGGRLLARFPNHVVTGLFERYVHVVETREPLALDGFAYPTEPLGGALRRFDIRGVAIGDGLAYTWRDVTDEGRLADALQQSERELRDIVDNLLDVVLRIRNGVIVWASPSSQAVLGWDPKGIVGQTREGLIHPDDLDRVLALNVASIATGTTQMAEYRVRCGDGSWAWVSGMIKLRSLTDDAATTMVALRRVDQEVALRAELDRNRRRFAAMFRKHDAIMLLVDPNTGAIVDANLAASRFYGYSEAELRAMTISQLNALPPAEVHANRQQALAGSRNSFVFPHRLADGRLRQVEVHSSPIEDDDRTLLFSIVRDVTDDLAARRALEHSEAQLRLNNTWAPVAMVMMDLDGFILDANAAAERLFRQRSSELSGRRLIDLAHPDGRSEIPSFGALLTRPQGVDHELRFIRSDGSAVWALTSVSVVRHDVTRQPMHQIAQLLDVTELHERRERLEHQALHDPLTGLANRTLFEEVLNRAATRAQRHRTQLAVIFCDLDDFKRINDTHGHHTGDRVLREIADRLRDSTRSCDTVARVGGDEFVIVAEDLSGRAEIGILVERVLGALRQPVSVGQAETVEQTVSLGVALAPNHGDPIDAWALLRSADAALYEAKQRGRDTWALAEAPAG